MFKHLIKKVREESNNPSILPENSSDEVNGHSSRDNVNGIDEESSPTASPQHRSSLSAQQSNVSNPRLSSTSNEPEKKTEAVTSLAEVFSSHIAEPISVDNFIQTLQRWVDSKEEALQAKDDLLQRLTQESSDLQMEVATLRTKLATLHSRRNSTTDSTVKTHHLQKQVDTLRSENENLKSTMKSLRGQLNDVEAERDDLLIKSTDVPHVKPSDDLQRQLDRQKADNEQQRTELAKLRQMLSERDAIIEEQDRRLLVDHETQAIQTDEDMSFVQVLAEPDVDTLSKLQAELDDKNRTIKNLQQRYNDLRKTLQREFHASVPKDLNQMGSAKATGHAPSSPTNLPLIHYDASAATQSDVDAAKRASTTRQMTAVRKNVTFTTANPSEPAAAASNATSPAILPHTPVEATSAKPQRNGHRSLPDGQAPVNGTNFKYLKHVLLKFMTSTEDEAIHLIRAVSTLLNFSVEEERFLRETLDYKMSWFGKVSRMKPLSANANF